MGESKELLLEIGWTIHLKAKEEVSVLLSRVLMTSRVINCFKKCKTSVYKFLGQLRNVFLFSISVVSFKYSTTNLNIFLFDEVNRGDVGIFKKVSFFKDFSFVREVLFEYLFLFMTGTVLSW